MAKKSSVVKNIRRQKIVDKFFNKRKELKAIIKNPTLYLNESNLNPIIVKPIKSIAKTTCGIISSLYFVDNLFITKL